MPKSGTAIEAAARRRVRVLAKSVPTRLTGAHHRAQPGRHIARDPPKLRREVERVDAELRPEAGGTAVKLAAVTTIQPNCGRTAQRQQVVLGRRQSESGKHAD